MIILHLINCSPLLLARSFDLTSKQHPSPPTETRTITPFPRSSRPACMFIYRTPKSVFLYPLVKWNLWVRTQEKSVIEYSGVLKRRTPYDHDTVVNVFYRRLYPCLLCYITLGGALSSYGSEFWIDINKCGVLTKLFLILLLCVHFFAVWFVL